MNTIIGLRGGQRSPEGDTVTKKKDEPLSRAAGGGRKAKAKAPMAFDPIDAALRQMHDRVASEAIPDDFMDLLDALDRKARNGGDA